MPKNILLLSSQFPKKQNVMCSLAQACNDDQINTLATTYTHLAIEIDTEKNSTVIFVDDGIPQIDAVYFRAWSQFRGISVGLAHILKQKTIPFINTDVGISTSDDKSYDYCAMSKSIPLPKTIIAYKEWLINNTSILKDRIKFPLILKSSSGKKGYDNYLINKPIEMSTTLKKYSADELFCVQEFIPNNFDYRIIVIGNKAVQAYIRTRDPKANTHVNNASQGASKTDVSLNSIPELCKLSEKAAKMLKREICGIDIVVNIHNGKHYVLEVNSSPSLPYQSTLKMIRNFFGTLSTS